MQSERQKKEEFAGAMCAAYSLKEFSEDKNGLWGHKIHLLKQIAKIIEPLMAIFTELIDDLTPKQRRTLANFVDDSRLALVSKASPIVTQSDTSFFPTDSVNTLIDAVQEDRCTFCQCDPDETRNCKYREAFSGLFVQKKEGIVSNGRCPYAR